MAFRGRGRGRGRGGMAGGYVKPEPFILFPEDVNLPDVKEVALERDLFIRNHNLQMYWKSSPYFLEEAAPTKSEDTEIERYSDRGKPLSQEKRNPLSYHLKLTATNFPAELIQGSRRVQHDQRKVCWDPERDARMLNLLQKREEMGGDKDEEDEKKKEEDEEDDEVEPEDEEPSDDDYKANIDFDDDDLDDNLDDGFDDEATY